jgi:gluconolactonase
MTRDPVQRHALSRRTLLAGTAGAALAGTAALARHTATAQEAAKTATPASVVTTPPRSFEPGQPSIYPDPDVIVVDPSFLPLRRTQGAIYRVWTGALWAEGPAWSSQGQYLVFSDVSGNVQYRYIWDDGRVTAFRRPSYNTNGNSFDYQGRQLSCEDFNRRVVRWEHNGTLTVIADSYQG